MTNGTKSRLRTGIRLLTRFGLTAIFAAAAVAVSGQSQTQQVFSSPEEAVKALKAAIKAKDTGALTILFGPRIRDFVSGDTIADKNAYDEFSARLGKSIKFETMTDKKATLVIGDDEWPFAAPLVKDGSQWRFDTDAGVEELLSRRIGKNEYGAMNVCAAYVLAQFEYFNLDDWDGDQVSEYAQKITSTPGQKDGLYWERSAADNKDSPLGKLFADAASEGYAAKTGTVKSATPFHGYYYKILFSQGASAPGGRFNYIINGNMIAGFALVAYPATWGNSGVMTFVVNQEGRVYQKDLGPRTGAIAAAMTQYNPDATWALSDVE